MESRTADATHASEALRAAPAPDPSRAAAGKRAPWSALLRLAVGLGVLGLVLRQVEVGDIGALWGWRTALAVATTTGLLVVAMGYSAARWRAILGAGAPPWSFLFRLYLVGQFFSLFLPTSIGGDAVRALAAARALPSTGEVISSVLLDRLSGLAALGFFLVAGALTSPSLLSSTGERLEWTLSPGTLAAGLVALAALAGLYHLLRPRLRGLERAVGEAWGLVLGLARSPAALLRVAGLALVVQGLYVASWMVLALGLGFDLPLAFFLFAVPLVSLVAMLPVSLNGLGLREGAWLFLLAPFGIAAGHAVAFGLLYFLAFTVVGGLGGLWFAARGVGR